MAQRRLDDVLTGRRPPESAGTGTREQRLLIATVWTRQEPNMLGRVKARGVDPHRTGTRPTAGGGRADSDPPCYRNTRWPALRSVLSPTCQVRFLEGDALNGHRDLPVRPTSAHHPSIAHTAVTADTWEPHMSPTAVFQQVPAPVGSLALSALVALLPLVTIFVLLGVLKWNAHFAALAPSPWRSWWPCSSGCHPAWPCSRPPRERCSGCSRSCGSCSPRSGCTR
jgi:hypothetical protein